MDLVVVPGNDWSGFAFGGPLVEAGGDWVPWCLLSLCLCAWVFGFCCGCCLIRQRASSPVGWAPPAQPRDPVCRWEAIARRALNFIRSRRRLSLAFAHLGTYSLRNTAESRPNLRRRAARRASTPGPILHEGPALDHGPNRERATGHHQSGGSVHMVRDIRSTGAAPQRGFGRPGSRERAGSRAEAVLGRDGPGSSCSRPSGHRRQHWASSRPHLGREGACGVDKAGGPSSDAHCPGLTRSTGPAGSLANSGTWTTANAGLYIRCPLQCWTPPWMRRSPR